MNFHWRELGNRPVQVKIEDLYILTTSAPAKIVNNEDNERIAQALKLKKLENVEMSPTRPISDDVTGLYIYLVILVTCRTLQYTDGQSRQNRGLVASLTTKVLNNLQITVKNIHLRYEDRRSDDVSYLCIHSDIFICVYSL